MRQIDYNNSAFTMRLELPIEWDIDNLTGVNIAIDERDGGDLLTATAATIQTATTNTGAIAVGDSTITITDEEYIPSAGDRMRIAASSAGPAEEFEVVSINNATKVATVRDEFRYAHATGTAVKGLWATYNLDTSTVATWTKGLQVVITWSPVGSDDLPFKERGEVSVFMFTFPDFDQRFRVLYPREYALARRYNVRSIYDEAKIQMQMDLSSRDFHLDRVVDQEMIRVAILKKARWIICEGGGDQWETERTVAMDEYQKQVEIITNQPMWLDENQDETKDDEEVDDYVGFLGLERGF